MGKTEIVTGASRGIGREIAKRLAADGFSLVISYSGNAAKAEEVAREIKSSGAKAIAVKANVDNEEEVSQLFEHTKATLGQIDVVVHSTGIMLLSPIIKNDVQQFDQGETLSKSYRVLKPGGTLVTIAGFPDQEQAKAHNVSALRVGHESDGARLGLIVGFCDSGHLQVLVDRSFPLADARAALARSAAGSAHGKILLRPNLL